jgi:hypothetical protein
VRDRDETNHTYLRGHDEWQKLLKCKIITLDGSKDIVYNVTEIDRALFER